MLRSHGNAIFLTDLISQRKVISSQSESGLFLCVECVCLRLSDCPLKFWEAELGQKCIVLFESCSFQNARLEPHCNLGTKWSQLEAPPAATNLLSLRFSQAQFAENNVVFSSMEHFACKFYCCLFVPCWEAVPFQLPTTCNILQPWK